MVALSAKGQDRKDQGLVLLAEVEDRSPGRGSEGPCGLVPPAIKQPVPIDAEYDSRLPALEAALCRRVWCEAGGLRTCALLEPLAMPPEVPRGSVRWPELCVGNTARGLILRWPGRWSYLWAAEPAANVMRLKLHPAR